METKWVFSDSPNTMVMTTNDILTGEKAILFVSHDSDDGMWQFHNGEDVHMDHAMLVSLKEIVDCDFTVTELVDLPLGWAAWRESLQKSWSMIKNHS